MLRKSITETEDDAVEINMSPMIDCIFILLIFFIVTTVFVEETGIEVNKPEASATIPLEKNSILIAVTADDRIIYGGKEISLSGVRATVKRLTTKEPLPVIIQSDEKASHGLFAKVYGEAKLGGAKQINFSTNN